jgi:hypothetical protein
LFRTVIAVIPTAHDTAMPTTSFEPNSLAVNFNLLSEQEEIQAKWTGRADNGADPADIWKGIYAWDEFARSPDNSV